MNNFHLNIVVVIKFILIIRMDDIFKSHYLGTLLVELL